MIIRRRELRLFVGVRLDPANPQCLTDAENLRRTVAPNLPIHWNFPTFVLSEPGYQVWHRFTDSFAEERDAILPMGFAGLHHPMLPVCTFTASILNHIRSHKTGSSDC